MEKQQILEQSRNLVSKIYEKMSVIETCDAVLDSISGLTLCFNDHDKNIITLDGVLGAEQIEAFGTMIKDEICKNQYEAQVFLKNLNDSHTVPEKKETDSTRGKRMIQPTPLTEQDIENLVKDYVDGKTIKNIAKEYHIGTARASEILSKHGVTRQVGKAKEEKEVAGKEEEAKQEIDFDKAVELHNQGKTLGEIAAALGCKKNAIHGYFEENGIRISHTGGSSVEYIGKYGKRK